MSGAGSRGYSTRPAGGPRRPSASGSGRGWTPRSRATWVRPANLPERVAYNKLVEEMLDPIVARGFTTLGDLRDAASRGNLKLSDVASPAEFLRGDRLLQSDRELARALDGVHRRGEVYLRWLQRFSALAFGTPAGRFLTLYLALPYGGVVRAAQGARGDLRAVDRPSDRSPCPTGQRRERAAARHAGPRGHQLRAVPPRVPGRSWARSAGPFRGPHGAACAAAQSSAAAATGGQRAGGGGLAVRDQAGPRGRSGLGAGADRWGTGRCP